MLLREPMRGFGATLEPSSGFGATLEPSSGFGLPSFLTSGAKEAAKAAGRSALSTVASKLGSKKKTAGDGGGVSGLSGGKWSTGKKVAVGGGILLAVVVAAKALGGRRRK